MEDVDVNDLKGMKVAVVMAWGGDYFLTERDDVELMRYSSLDSLALVLKNGVVDAVALDYVTALELAEMVPAFGIVEEPLTDEDYIMYVNNDRTDLLEQLNEFFLEFKASDMYADTVSILNFRSMRLPL